VSDSAGELLEVEGGKKRREEQQRSMSGHTHGDEPCTGHGHDHGHSHEDHPLVRSAWLGIASFHILF
jgi:hypothetical protein